MTDAPGADSELSNQMGPEAALLLELAVLGRGSDLVIRRAVLGLGLQEEREGVIYQEMGARRMVSTREMQEGLKDEEGHCKGQGGRSHYVPSSRSHARRQSCN